MKIVFAADHRGVALKDYLAAVAREQGHDVVDVGTCGGGSVDYVDFGLAAAEMVACGEADRGVLVCATGIGMCILANKVPGVRAALCGTTYVARLTRLHNDSNVLALAGDITAPRYAAEIMETWLATVFEGGRHERRLGKIKQIEEKYSK